MWRDVTFACRLFRKQIIPFVVVIAGLAITIGLSTAMFSIVNAIAFSSTGIRGVEAVRRLAFPGSLSIPLQGAAFQGQCGLLDYVALKNNSASLILTASSVDGSSVAVRGVSSDLVPVAAVTGNFFDFFNVRAARGRTLAAADDASGAPLVVVVTYGFWINRLGGARDVVGRTIEVDDQPFMIVGVLERGFRVPVGGGMVPPVIWTTFANRKDLWQERKAAAMRRTESELRDLRATQKPTAASASAYATRLKELRESAMEGRDWNPAVDVIGRVARKDAPSAALAEVSALVTARLANYGRTLPPGVLPVTFESLDRHQTSLLAIGTVLMTVVTLLVLLACANVTNLLLANAIARAREMGTRLALGASRARIIRQLLTESVLLSLCAGAVGYVVAMWLVPVLATSLRTPLSVDVSPDVTVYGFVAMLIMLVGTVAGLAPISFGRRDELLSALNSSQMASGGITGGRLRALLICAQSAISVVLLTIATLLAQSVMTLSSVRIGYDIDKLMVATVRTSSRPWSLERQKSFWRLALDRIRQVPGISHTALVSIPPFSLTAVPRLPNGLAVNRIEVSADYFDTLGLRLLRGRSFTMEEVASNAPVAVISETLATRFWKNQDAIGSTLERVWGEVHDGPTTDEWAGRRAETRIVGVVAHGARQLKDGDAPTIFLPLSPTTTPRLVARSAAGLSESLAAQVREALGQVDADANAMITYPRDNLRNDLEPLQTLAALGALIGLGSLLLAIMGIFGVIGFHVGQRRREIGIRLSIGATSTSIIRTILQGTLTATAVGTVTGLGLAVPASRVFQSVLVGVTPGDPVAVVTAAALFMTSAAIAALIPARRALDVDVNEAINRV